MAAVPHTCWCMCRHTSHRPCPSRGCTARVEGGMQTVSPSNSIPKALAVLARSKPPAFQQRGAHFADGLAAREGVTVFDGRAVGGRRADALAGVRVRNGAAGAAISGARHVTQQADALATALLNGTAQGCGAGGRLGVCSHLLEHALAGPEVAVALRVRDRWCGGSSAHKLNIDAGRSGWISGATGL